MEEWHLKKKWWQLISCLYTHLNCLNENPEWFSRVILKGIYPWWYAPSWYFFFNLNVIFSARNNLCLRYRKCWHPSSFLVPYNNNNPYGVFIQRTRMVYCIAFLNSIYLMITSLTMMTLMESCVAYKYRKVWVVVVGSETRNPCIQYLYIHPSLINPSTWPSKCHVSFLLLQFQLQYQFVCIIVVMPFINLRDLTSSIENAMQDMQMKSSRE